MHRLSRIDNGTTPAVGGCEHNIDGVDAPAGVSPGASVALSMTLSCFQFAGCFDQPVTISGFGEEFRLVEESTGDSIGDDIGLATRAPSPESGSTVTLVTDPSPTFPDDPGGEVDIQFRVGDCIERRTVDIFDEAEPPPEPEPPAFDPTAIERIECTVTPTRTRPESPVTLRSAWRNPNAQPAFVTVGWFLSDLPNGPGLGTTTIRIPAGGTQTSAFDVFPEDVPELAEFIGEEFTSVARARVLPGSVEPATPVLATVADAARDVDRGTALAAGAGLAGGVGSLLLRR